MHTEIEDSHAMIKSLDRQPFFGIILDFNDNRVIIGEFDVGDKEWHWAVLEGFTIEQFAWIKRDRGPAVLLDFVCGHVDGPESEYVSRNFSRCIVDRAWMYKEKEA